MYHYRSMAAGIIAAGMLFCTAIPAQADGAPQYRYPPPTAYPYRYPPPAYPYPQQPFQPPAPIMPPPPEPFLQPNPDPFLYPRVFPDRQQAQPYTYPPPDWNYSWRERRQHDWDTWPDERDRGRRDRDWRSQDQRDRR